MGQQREEGVGGKNFQRARGGKGKGKKEEVIRFFRRKKEKGEGSDKESSSLGKNKSSPAWAKFHSALSLKLGGRKERTWSMKEEKKKVKKKQNAWINPEKRSVCCMLQKCSERRAGGNDFRSDLKTLWSTR